MSPGFIDDLGDAGGTEVPAMGWKASSHDKSGGIIEGGIVTQFWGMVEGIGFLETWSGGRSSISNW